MKLRRFPPENVHKRTGKGADKSHDRCRIRRSTTCYTTEKARRLSPSRFSVACSLACREDVIFVRWLSYSCSFLIKMRFRQEKKSRDDWIHQSGKRLLYEKKKSYSKKNEIVYDVVTWGLCRCGVFRKYNWNILFSTFQLRENKRFTASKVKCSEYIKGILQLYVRI